MATRKLEIPFSTHTFLVDRWHRYRPKLREAKCFAKGHTAHVKPSRDSGSLLTAWDLGSVKLCNGDSDNPSLTRVLVDVPSTYWPLSCECPLGKVTSHPHNRDDVPSVVLGRPSPAPILGTPASHPSLPGFVSLPAVKSLWTPIPVIVTWHR